MTDNLHRSFDNLSVNRPTQTGSLSSNNSSVRSPPGSLGPMYQYGHMPPTNDPQSASARFERFFNPSSPPTSSSHTFDATNSFSQHPTSASLGPGSSAIGLANNGAFGSFGHSFTAGNSFGNNSTVPALRSKSSGIRQSIPSQWSTNVDESSLGSFSSPTFPPNGSTTTAQSADDDIIPTAIVVKNIPFSIKREQLLQIIEDLQIPMPYAFNYHFDQGVFRGLAFANFRTGEEADAVVAALNGFDVSGRKLRVEYKKVLQAGEKERIEKEKAIKRMQSMQMEKERVRRQVVPGPAADDWGSQYGSVSSHSAVGGGATKTRGPELDSGYGEAVMGESGVPLTSENLRNVADTHTEIAAGAASEVGGRKDELDLNDPATLEIYSRVLLFKDDRMRDELSFSKSLTAIERRIVHMVSKKLGLYHYSMGEGDERFVTVTKNDTNQAQRPLRTQASTIGRSNRGEAGVTNHTTNGLLAPGTMNGRNALRTKKSAPDMKRQRERSEDGTNFSNTFSFGQGNPPSAHANALSRKSNSSLREGYSSSLGRRSAQGGVVGGAAGLQSLFSSSFDVPPVPALPSNASDPNSTYGFAPGSHSSSPSPIGVSQSNTGSASSSSQHILRQPAGPGSAHRNFAQRSRVPLGGSSPSENTVSLPEHRQSESDLKVADRFAIHGDLRDNDVRTHEPLEV